MRSRYSGRLLLSLAAAALLAACNPTPSNEASTSSSAPPLQTVAADAPRLVRTVLPEPGTLTATRSSSARIRATRDATVASGASARVTSVIARAGTIVSEGDVVIELDADQAQLQRDSAALAVRRAEIDLDRATRSTSEGVDQARASLLAAESNVANLERQAGELRDLVAAGGAARSDLDSLEANLDSARANLVQARDALARAERAGEEDLALLELALDSAEVGLAQAQDALDETAIRAPFTGEIAEVFLEVGEFAGAGAPAFRIQTHEDREAVFDVAPEAATALLDVGTVTLRYAGRDVPATLTTSARPSQQERLVQLTALLGGADAATIPSGAVAEVRYDVPLAEGLLIPSGAIASESGGTWVYAAQDGEAVRLAVDVLSEAGATAAVRGDAIDLETLIIHPRPLDVRIGTLVRTEP